MKIAIFNPFLEWGGGGRAIMETSKRFVNSGHEVTLYTGRISQDFSMEAKIHEIKVHITWLPFNDQIFLLNSFVTGLKFHGDHDLLLPWVFPSNIAAALAKSKLDKPLIWFCQEPAKLLYEDITLKYIRDYRPFHIYIASLFLKKALKPIDQWSAEQADLILANSRYTAECVKRAYGIKAKVIHTGVDITFFRPKVVRGTEKKFGIPPKARVLLFSGRLYPPKRADIAIRTAAILLKQHPDLLLIITGSGPEKQKLELLTKRLGIQDKVKFFGVLRDSEMVDLYNISEIVLFPSINEPWGLVPLEAMACGKPVVAFKCGGPSESIIHGKTGLLVKKIGDVDAFARAVSYLLDNPEIAEKMGKLGRERSKIYSWENVFPRLLNAISEVRPSR